MFTALNVFIIIIIITKKSWRYKAGGECTHHQFETPTPHYCLKHQMYLVHFVFFIIIIIIIKKGRQCKAERE